MACAAVPVDDTVYSETEADAPVDSHTYNPTQGGYWLCLDARLPAMRQRLANFAGLQVMVLSGEEHELF